jgi:hypothetical protein
LIQAAYLLADRTRGEEDLDEAPEDEDHQAGKQHGAQVAAKKSTGEEVMAKDIFWAQPSVDRDTG